jgi:hypothetical protein
MTSKSLGTSLEASLDFKFHHLKSLKSRTREQGFKLSAGRNFRRFVVGPVILAFLLSPAGFVREALPSSRSPFSSVKATTTFLIAPQTAQGKETGLVNWNP